jgi:hypothetical protein
MLGEFVSRRFKAISQIVAISVGGVAAPLPRFHEVLSCYTYSAQTIVMRYDIRVPSFYGYITDVIIDRSVLR